MTEIIPAIMPHNLDDLRDKLSLVADHVDIVQIDIMDGQFVKGKTWPYVGRGETFESILEEAEGMPFWDKVDFEIDLMVKNPENVVDDWIAAGAARIIIHVESTKNLETIVKTFRERFAYPPPGEPKDLELGLALNIDTSLDSVLPYLEDIDFVQFMGIEVIGVQGEEFSERVIDKIREFHNAHPEVILSVDGGVSLENAHKLVEAGVKRLVSGSALFNNTDILGALDEFKHI
jgi:ribulose-phosphate 3-epimerase